MTVAIKHFQPQPHITGILYVDANGRSYRCNVRGTTFSWQPEPSPALLETVEGIVQRVLGPEATWRSWPELPAGKRFFDREEDQPYRPTTKQMPLTVQKAAKQPTQPRRLQARYPGVCRLTSRPFSAGTQIIDTRFGWAIDDEQTAEILKAIRESEGDFTYYGRVQHRVGQVIRHNGEAVVVTAVVVVREPEDIDEFDDRVVVFYRPATEAEATELTAAEAKARARAEAQQIIVDAEQRIHREGISPTPSGSLLRLVGEIVCDTRTTFGGGGYFVLDEDGDGPQGVPAIWHVRNNGGDGDDWSANNVSTGGAGGIGSWIPWKADLAEDLRQADAVLAQTQQSR